MTSIYKEEQVAPQHQHTRREAHNTTGLVADFLLSAAATTKESKAFKAPPFTASGW